MLCWGSTSTQAVTWPKRYLQHAARAAAPCPPPQVLTAARSWVDSDAKTCISATPTAVGPSCSRIAATLLPDAFLIMSDVWRGTYFSARPTW